MATYQGAYTGPQIDALLGRVNSSTGSLGLSSTIVVTCNNVTDSKRTFSNDAITSSMIVIGVWLSNPSAMGAPWTITTNNGTITFGGTGRTIVGTTNVVLILSTSAASVTAT